MNESNKERAKKILKFFFKIEVSVSIHVEPLTIIHYIPIDLT